MNNSLTRRFVGTILVCLCLNVSAGEKVDKTLEAPLDGFVEVHNVRGDIKLIGWSEPQVKVTGTLDDLTEKFIFTSEDGHTLIKVKLPRNSHNRSRGGSDLRIMVPENSKVSFSGVATDLDMKKVFGGVDINSVSGDIDLSEAKGRIYINSVSGDLKLKALVGGLEISTVSGDISAEVDSNNVSVSGVSADINLQLKDIQSATLSTVSGDAKITGKLLDNGEIKLNSVSGDALFYSESLINAEISMETAPGGNIVNNYSEHQPKKTFINSQNLRFSTGDGNGSIRMSTVSGTIGIKKTK